MKEQIRLMNQKVNYQAIDDFNDLDGYAFANFQAGEYAEAKKMYERIYDLTHSNFEELNSRHHVWRHRYAAILLVEGKTDSAKQLIQEHLDFLLGPQSSISVRSSNAYDIAGAYALMGDRENAYKWLDQLTYSDLIASLITRDVMFDSLRGESRFEAILNEISRKRAQSAATLENIIAGDDMQVLLR